MGSINEYVKDLDEKITLLKTHSNFKQVDNPTVMVFDHKTFVALKGFIEKWPDFNFLNASNKTAARLRGFSVVGSIGCVPYTCSITMGVSETTARRAGLPIFYAGVFTSE